MSRVHEMTTASIMGEDRRDHSLCGWRLRSAIPLLELPAWSGDDRAPDVEFVIGSVPDGLAEPVLHTPVMQIDAAGRALIHIDGVADYLVDEGRRITVAPAMPVSAPDVRLFLLGMGLGLLCHQRGVLPIHAAVVDVDGRAVLLAGASGSGKSTLAAGFMRQGYRVSCDDVAPLAFASDGAWILPGPPHLRLWRDAARQAGQDVAKLEPCRIGMEKYSLPVADRQGDPLMPAMIVHVDRMSGDAAIAMKRLRGVDAMEGLRTQVYRRESLVRLVGQREALRRIAAAASAIPRHALLSRPITFDAIDATVDAIVSAVRSDQWSG